MGSKTIFEKIADLESQKEQLGETINELQSNRDGHDQVIELGEAFKLFRRFREDFGEYPVHRQRKIIREVVRQVILVKGGVRLLYYTIPREELIEGTWLEDRLDKDAVRDGGDPLPDGGLRIVQIGGGGVKVVEPLAVRMEYPVRWKRQPGSRSGNRK